MGAQLQILNGSQLHAQVLDLGLQDAQRLGAAGRYAEAVNHCEHLLALAPQCPEIWSELASNYLSGGSVESAELGFRMAMDLAPDVPEHRFNWSVALQRLQRFEESIPVLLEVLRKRPEHYRAWNNLSAAFMWIGEFEPALTAVNQALRLEPTDPTYLWNRSLLRLRRGDFVGGWPDYEARYETLPRPAVRRTWQGDVQPDKTLWVACEQGLGDTLQFLRFLPWARERVGGLVLGCPPALKTFLSSQGMADQVVTHEVVPEQALSVRLMSLPFLMGLAEPAQIPRQRYLKADPQRIERMRERFVGEQRPIVALAWKGSSSYGADAQRSIPLQQLLPILQSWNARFVSVQKGAGEDQIDALDPKIRPDRLRPEDDADGAFVDTAALLSVCDAVLSVDSAVGHLAGGLGVPTTLMMPHVSDWRWGTREQPLVWYDSVCQVRQARPGDWGSVMAQIQKPAGA